MLNNFYVSLFPRPSPAELPPGEENEELNLFRIREQEAARARRGMVGWISLSLSLSLSRSSSPSLTSACVTMHAVCHSCPLCWHWLCASSASPAASRWRHIVL